MSALHLNTLYLNTDQATARLTNDTVRVEIDDKKVLAVPLHHVGAVVAFGNVRLTTSLIMHCASSGRSVGLLDFAGRYKARVEGPVSGNVLLRRAQVLAAEDPARALAGARRIVAAKIQNSRQVLMRANRDDPDKLFTEASGYLVDTLKAARDAATMDELRGVEGVAARTHFACFDAMIKKQRMDFRFDGRSRRPPRDRVNALLSFLYAIA
ncbi:MAG: CRISPR-associated endonuclease Cas1, partial [Fimbriimonadaceae bacterium]